MKKYQRPILTPLYKGRASSAAEVLARWHALGAGLPSLPELTATYPYLLDAFAVFLGGSLVMGWGHARSDLDILAIFESRAPVDGADAFQDYYPSVDRDDGVGGIGVICAEHDGIRTDVELWDVAQIDAMLTRVETAEHYIPAEREIEFFYQLSIGIPISNHQWVEATKQRLHRSPYASVRARRLRAHAEGLLEDVVGLLESGDIASALRCVRMAFDTAAEALLATSGDVSAKQKWLARRIERYEPYGFSVADYWAVETMRGYDDADAGSWIKTTARACQQLVAETGRRLSQ